MVLQRNKPVAVWGNADYGEAVAVKFNGQEVKTIAQSDGKWIVKLNSMSEGGPFEMNVSGTNTITFKNVMVGEVWLCSGQSNMELSVEKSANAEVEIAKANYPNIRTFNVKHAVSDTLQDDCSGSWVECNPHSIGKISAAAYYFGRELYDELKVPIGLVQATWGGTAAECWVSKAVLDSDPDFQPILQRWTNDLQKYPEAVQEYKKNLSKLTEDWKIEAEKAKQEGRREPRKPQEPRGPGSRHTPTGLFNAMINPLIPYTIQGVIWYQGEANAKRAYQYRKLFPDLISEWRTKWGLGDIPFYYVQLPNIFTEPELSTTGWTELREAQLMTLSLPNTGMAVTIDIGEAQNLHPLNKQDVGYRLSLIAKANVYGKKNLVYSGPIFKSMNKDGNKVRLKFNHIGGGLTIKDGNGLKGFVIAGADKQFLPAEAVIDGNDVLVWNNDIKNPVAVRYGWSDNPVCELFNKAMLPASPFRTDAWQGITFKNN
jgi:sialate O-acetylesterase